ncbi:MAG: sigma-54-dependent Fis family transcriptional regulator [Deltaproteobacteria bacterium]|nr:sigma-54-dependent Fis family transcriptional regulator [Deltaproteobacteria bacterium]
MSEILVVDDERSMREILEIMLSKEGYSVQTAKSAETALEVVAEQVPNLIITDLKMKGASGLDLLRQVKSRFPGIEVIVITAFATTETALEALKLGAYDYITKPFEVDEIKVVVHRALERHKLLRENLRMRAELKGGYDFGDIVGKSPRMQEVYRIIEQVAPSRSNILLTGESGTGKELVAKAIHLRSPRGNEPFVPIDCASIPEQLLESELFGYVKGAFTGAATNRQGLFELANRGTVFLDEIAEMPPAVQVKLLRVVQERSIRRLGEGKDRPIDVRLVAATNREIEDEVRKGAFREDLFFRLNVIQIQLPPLRERREDIADLVRHFAQKIAGEEGQAVPIILTEALEALDMYDFPGNVRELQNMVERAVALSSGRPIGQELFTEYMQKGLELPIQPVGELPDDGVDLEAMLASIERNLLEQALQRAGGVKKKAARLLRISFRSIRYRLQKLGLD